MVNSSEKKGKKNLVLIGVGFSGLELIRNWLSKPGMGSVTIIAECAADFFYFDALCSLKNVRNSFDGERIPDTGRCRFLVAGVQRIDVSRKRIFLPDEKLNYDFLVLVNECRPKILAHKKGRGLPCLAGRNSFETLIRKQFKQVVVRGNGFVALALAEHLIEKGVELTLVCGENSLANPGFPMEEACLVAKKLRTKGIRLFFSREIEMFRMGPDGEITGVELNDGVQLPCQLVIHENGSFGAFSHLANPSLHSLKPVLAGVSESESDDQVYTLGVNLYSGEAVSGDFSYPSLSDQGRQLARKIIGPDVVSGPSSEFGAYHRLAGLDWFTYGDLSTFCGNNSHNFYWEHPNGSISFRLVFDKHHFFVQALGMLGISFDPQFVAHAFRQKQHASDFISGLVAGMPAGEKNRELIPLIGRAFSVEFEGLKNENRPSFLSRILEKFR